MGTWEHPGESIDVAMDRTNHIMASSAGIRKGTEVVDLGSGYGATARFLASEYGCRVRGINISPKENAFAVERVREAGLSDQVTIEYGDFHDLQLADDSADVVWSQEALLHGVDKTRILSECLRALRQGGTLVVSDLLVRGDLGDDERQRIYDRVRSPGMWDFEQYLKALAEVGFDVVRSEDWPQNVAPTYANVRSQLVAQRESLAERVPPEQISKTVAALQLWVDSAEAGKISHGFFVARKP